MSNYNHKTVPRVKVTLEDTKLYSFGAEMRDDLRLYESLCLLYLNTEV